MDINLGILSSSQGFRILGESSNDKIGSSVSSAGDINGDGYADVIIAAEQYYSSAGKSYIIFGKANGFSDVNLGTLSIAQGFRIIGESSSGQCGFSVSGAGDMNGDGYDDVIAGKWCASNGAGKSYVIFGKANGFSDINLDTLNPSQGFRIIGEEEDNACGASVNSAGDINGDGYADVIIGAPHIGTGGTGKSYVIFGKDNGFSDISLWDLSSCFWCSHLSPLTTQGFRIEGANGGDRSGHSVSSAGDVNGDGYDDIIIGAPYTRWNGKGTSYVIFGKTWGTVNWILDISLWFLAYFQGFRIFGENRGDKSGYSVSGAGDVNGDGYADVIIGAPFALSNKGQSYVIFGKASGFSDISLSALTIAQGFRILGENISDYAGRSVSAGDINNDGYDDVIIDGGGKSYVIFGKAGSFSDINLSTLNSSQGFRILKDNKGDLSGYSVSGAGDVNGDGYADVIIGLPQAASGFGESYVLFAMLPLYVTANNITMTYGGTIHVLTSSYRGFVNSEGPSNLIAQPTILTTATSASNPGSYPITVAGGVSSHYYIIYVNGMITINKTPLQITANSETTTYGTLPVLTVNYSGFVNFESSFDLISQPIVSIDAISTSRPGNYPIIVSGAVSNNYEFTYVEGTLTINKAPLRVTANSVTMTYGETIPVFTVIYEGFVNSEGPSSLLIQPKASTLAIFSSSPGSYSIIASEGLSNNYEFTYVEGTLTINKAPLQITANSMTMTYGETIPTFTESYSGFVNSENSSNLVIKPTISTTATTKSCAGSYAITVTGGESNNYAFDYNYGTLTINKAPLEIIPNNVTTIAGIIPAFTLSYNGFVNSENPFNLITQPIATTSTLANSGPGVYPIIVSGGKSDNYDFIYKEGYLIIHEASLASNSVAYFINIGIPVLIALSVGTMGLMVCHRLQSKQEHILINKGVVDAMVYTALGGTAVLPTVDAKSIEEGSEDGEFDANDVLGTVEVVSFYSEF